MAFSTSNIGKNCYINISEDQNIEDSLYGTIIGYYSDSNEEYYFVSINGNVEKIYDDNLINIISGSGGDVTAEAVASAIGDMTSAQAAQARSDLGAASAETTVTVTDTAATVQPEANHIYNCGELVSLTISNPPATGAWSVVFTSGATATTTTIPSTILGLENFAAEANTLYEVNVMDNRAVVGSWEVASA
jgi:hypothetical protein